MDKYLVVRFIHGYDPNTSIRVKDFDRKCVKFSTETMPLISFLDEQDNLVCAIHERFIEQIDVRED